MKMRVAAPTVRVDPASMEKLSSRKRLWAPVKLSSVLLVMVSESTVKLASEKSPAVIVHLGDYVDRGPDSKGVIEQILALEAMFEGSDRIRVVSLKGNHEQMMLDAFDASGFDPDEGGHWFMNGGSETADSYAGGPGRADRNWRDTLPKEHVAFLRRLPTLWRAGCNKHVGLISRATQSTGDLCDDRVGEFLVVFVILNDQTRPLLSALTGGERKPGEYSVAAAEIHPLSSSYRS